MSIILEKITKNICSILINRPSKRNALNLELVRQLKDAICEFECDSQYSVAILSGAGGNFCSGYDLNEVIDIQTGTPNIQMIEQMLWPLGTNLSDKKIVVASIEGHAVGFGYELALKCDFRVADKDSRMGFLNRRFGFPIMNGGTVILPQLIGQSRAIELIATGKAQLAHQALEYGLLNFASDIGCSQGQSLNLARSLAKFRQDCLMLDIDHAKYNSSKNSAATMELLIKERQDSIEYLRRCGPFDTAVEFLKGNICRHGSTNLGNLLNQVPEMTL